MSLFDPGFIGSLEILNRFVRSATGEFAANKDGTITKLFFPLFSNLAMGEVGLIIGGDLYVLDEGKASHEMAGISQDYHLSGHKELTKIVHGIGTSSKLAAQLSHSGAHSISAKAPSIRDDMQVVPMDHDDIENVIIGFRDSAIRAKKAGYDAIQLHAAHGYLLSQFLSKRTNHRTDAWGGSSEKRAQLLFTIYSEVRSVVGSNFPIILKINGSDDPIEGFSVAESSEVLSKLADDGLNAVEISGMNPARAIKKSNEAYFS
ncbi:MAG: NADH:flavin oxidoreductase, partial [Candidatus Hodarchaeales archaeon]